MRAAASWTKRTRKESAGSTTIPLGTRVTRDTERDVQDYGRDHTEVVRVEDKWTTSPDAKEVQEVSQTKVGCRNSPGS